MEKAHIHIHCTVLQSMQAPHAVQAEQGCDSYESVPEQLPADNAEEVSQSCWEEL